MRCTLFSILSATKMHWKFIFQSLYLQNFGISLAKDSFGMMFHNLFSMQKSLFIVNMAMRWEMRLKNSSHVKMMNHHEKQPKNKNSSILEYIFSNWTRRGRLLKETAVYKLFTTTFLVNKVASTSVLITTNKQKITQFHGWVNNFSIVLKSKLSSLIALVKVKLICIN